MELSRKIAETIVVSDDDPKKCSCHCRFHHWEGCNDWCTRSGEKSVLMDYWRNHECLNDFGRPTPLQIKRQAFEKLKKARDGLSKELEERAEEIKVLEQEG